MAQKGGMEGIQAEEVTYATGRGTEKTGIPGGTAASARPAGRV